MLENKFKNVTDLNSLKGQLIYGQAQDICVPIAHNVFCIRCKYFICAKLFLCHHIFAVHYISFHPITIDHPSSSCQCLNSALC